MLHVHDLVDNVTKESLLAGYSAGLYANGKLDTEKPFNITTGDGVRYVVPTTAYMNNEKFDIMFRLSKRIEKSTICVMQGEEIIYKKFVLAGEGNEMQTITVDKSNIKGDVVVMVKEGRV